MSSTAFTNIGLLVTNDPGIGEGALGLLKNVTVLVEDGVIVSIGNSIPLGVDTVIDLENRTVLPGFVDSHTHLIFAGDRSDEFAARSSGTAYTAGGIKRTVAATRAATPDQLRVNAQHLLNEALLTGTTTVEIKSGYGLSPDSEALAIDIASEFTDETTLLAAHVVPEEYSGDADSYIQMIIDTMIPRTEAKWIDVFCDRGAFTPEQTRRIFTAAKQYGLLPRIHANQLEPGEGVAIAIEFDAASADHLSTSSKKDIELLAASNTVATLLPGAEFSTHLVPGIGRTFLDAGAKVAIATDCNPGSSFTTSMPFCIASAVSLLGFTVDEAILAATAGGAAALRRTDIGKISSGYTADFIALDAPSYIHLAYRPGVNLVRNIYTSGKEVRTWQK
ncbi:HutI Imidazolonepropionase and related amidohydrolases [Candidatus Nanopelagicaceae bacterium]